MIAVSARRYLSTEDRQSIDLLAAQGLRAWAISSRTGLNRSTVQWFMYSSGLAGASAAPRPMYLRNGRTVKPFSPAEDALILKLRGAGLIPPRIADVVNKRLRLRRSAHSIYTRLVMLAGRDELRQEPATPRLPV